MAKTPPRSDNAGDATASKKRGRGRPPKSESGSQPNDAVSARKPSGRPKRNVAAVARESSQVTSVDGSRKRGRTKKADASVPPAPVKKTVGRPKKATEATTGQAAADPRELKKKALLLQKKVKQAAEKLEIAVSAMGEVQKIVAGM